MTVIFSLPSNKLEDEVSSPKLFESTDIYDVDSGGSEVAAVNSDSVVDVDVVAVTVDSVGD